MKQATTLGYEGVDIINNRYTRWAYGFHLGGRATMPGEGESSFGERSTRHTFGHMGNRSNMAWADSQHRLVVAFTCNRLLSNPETRQRWIRLNNAVWDAIGV
jgi:CubicO group peptidase (beta-lactamase class C family)